MGPSAPALSTAPLDTATPQSATPQSAPRRFATTDELLRSAARALGLTLTSWQAARSEPTSAGDVHAYTVELADADGKVRTEALYLETNPPVTARPEVLRLTYGTDSVFDVWVYPADPALPALSRVVYPDSATALLEELGVRLDVSALVVDSYRPSQRAVIRATGPQGTVFLKILRPAKAAVLADKHRLFSSSGVLVPGVLGWSPDGVVVLSQLPGIEAKDALTKLRDQDAFLDSLAQLLVSVASVPAIYTARASLVDNAEWYTQRLARACSERADDIATVGVRILALRDSGRSYLPSPVTMHGDLHLGQIFVDPGDPTQVTGLLDIDTAGAGDLADDAGSLYAHLHALACNADLADPAYAAACRALASRALARWSRNPNAGFVSRARAIGATHLLGHALRAAAGGSPDNAHQLLHAAQELVK